MSRPARPQSRGTVEEGRAGQVQSVARAVAILRAIAESGDGKPDYAVWRRNVPFAYPGRPSEWYILLSTTNYSAVIPRRTRDARSPDTRNFRE